MNIAVLTGGGDCPGLNAVMRAIVGLSLAEALGALKTVDPQLYDTARQFFA